MSKINVNKVPKILVVEKDNKTRNMLHNLLIGKGYNVSEAKTESECRKKLKTEIYDVIITEIELENKKSGLAILNEVKEKTPYSAVIIISNCKELKIISESINLGAVDYIQKDLPDVLNKILLPRIEEVLQSQSLIPELIFKRQTVRKIKPARRMRGAEGAAIDEEIMQKEMIERTNRLEQMGELAAGIAHQIKNDLALVSMWSELLLTEGYPKPNEAIKIIYETSQRSGRIVGKLLEFYRSHTVGMKPTNTNNVVEDSLFITEYHRRINSIKLSKNLEDGLPSVSGDDLLLSQVFINIINNSIQAMQDSEEKTLSVKTNILLTNGHTSQVQTDIADTGYGIPSENLDKIFKGLTTKKAGEGTGLGLKLCGDIIARHNGVIKVKSEVGKGTTFSIILPTILE